VDIRFISTLTPEDENLMAPGVLKALSALLDLLPIAYMIRIDTSDGQVYQVSQANAGDTRPSASSPLTSPFGETIRLDA
jgi:hypothetical protein